MIEGIVKLAKDPETRKALIFIGFASGVFLMVKAYHDIKLTKLRIKEIEEKS
jgi:hypothetical protein|tara:strand:- start:339 stop:494 length:156 start_codon:yes stop_codon:yes gene_type:complete